MSWGVDNDYLGLLLDEDGALLLSDEEYAEQAQLQEAIITSLSSCRPETNSDEMAIPQKKLPVSSKRGKIRSDEMGIPANQVKRVQTKKSSVTESGESSSARSRQTCGICLELKSGREFFRNPNCSHMFCSDCIRKHLTSKIQDNITEVRCPDVSCKSLLKPEYCRSVLPSAVFERWDDSLSEAAIPRSQKFYCPYKKCSGIMIHKSVKGGNITRESECPYCHRLFCANCKVPWHANLECEEFQKLKKGKVARDDLLFENLAKRKHWQNCPKCKYVVDRNGGCLHITCRCGFEFCYSCGARWSLTHNCLRE